MKTKTLLLVTACAISSLIIAVAASPLKSELLKNSWDFASTDTQANTTTKFPESDELNVSEPPDDFAQSLSSESPDVSNGEDTSQQTEIDRINQANSQAVDIRYDVPLIPQQTGQSCWAAGIAMLVSWKGNMSVSPSEIAATPGYSEAEGLAPDDTGILSTWGMQVENARTYTVDGFRQLLEAHGPLWVASAEPSAHVRVITGMSGDGTPEGTFVHINDPWEKGMQDFRLPNSGSTYSESYTEFVRKQEELGYQELNKQGIYVAYIK